MKSKAQMRYVDFKVAAPALLEKVNKNPGYDDRRQAWYYAAAHS